MPRRGDCRSNVWPWGQTCSGRWHKQVCVSATLLCLSAVICRWRFFRPNNDKNIDKQNLIRWLTAADWSDHLLMKRGVIFSPRCRYPHCFVFWCSGKLAIEELKRCHLDLKTADANLKVSVLANPMSCWTRQNSFIFDAAIATGDQTNSRFLLVWIGMTSASERAHYMRPHPVCFRSALKPATVMPSILSLVANLSRSRMCNRSFSGKNSSRKHLLFSAAPLLIYSTLIRPICPVISDCLAIQSLWHLDNLDWRLLAEIASAF